MRKKVTLTESQLRQVITNTINESLKGSIKRGLGNLAMAGGLAAGALGVGYGLEAGLDADDAYRDYVNQEAGKNLYGTDYHYQQWCDQEGMNPDDNDSHHEYQLWVQRQLPESRKLRKLVEQIVRETLRNR